MKATGIVRRIDDLGRVVIPKEIRRTMRIREGDPLEIYTSNDGEVIFKKYSPIGEMSEHAAQVADIMHRLAGCPVAIFDRDHVVSVSGAAKKEWNARRVSPELEDLMEQRKMYYAENGASGMIPAEGVEKHAVENNWNPDFAGTNESAEAIGLLYNKTIRRILLGKKVRTGGKESVSPNRSCGRIADGSGCH